MFRLFHPLVLVSLCFFAGGCANHAPPNLTPAGVAAYNGTRVIKALDLLRDVAIDANAQRPPLVSEALTRKIVVYHRSSLQVIHATPTGWKPVVQAGLVELAKDVPAAEAQVLSPYLALANTLLQEIK